MRGRILAFRVSLLPRPRAWWWLLAACCGSTAGHFTTGGPEVGADPAKTYNWSFDGDPTGALPADLIDVLGLWQVATETTAPSPPHVLRQAGSFADGDFPRVLVKSLTWSDVTVRVRCRPESGATDRACGLIFRAQDSDNYYVTRANALEGNVRLYHVIAGDRVQFASADRPVSAGQWHTLEATAKGTAITVKWDGEVVIQATDSTFAKGRVGLWTKADSATAFDELQVTTP